ncbi:MAG: MerR family transcriptional regulator [Chitinophagaceae bacterium]|nr:MerR family transcriptional regulator [Chitinophagaceae bacterium]
MATNNLFTIKDLENLSGIKAHTIRIWEQRYNFLKPSRTNTNIRYYTNDELKTILNVSLLNKYGVKISQINKLSEAEVQKKIINLNQTEAQEEQQVNELLKYMLTFNLENFELLLDKTIKAKGIQKTVTTLVFPFLEKIGILWLTNHIIPAQEHLVTNIIRQKIIMAIEKAPLSKKKKTPLFYFCPKANIMSLVYCLFILC